MRNSAINFNKSKILRIMIALQLALVSVVVIDFVGIEIPILREAIGFIYLAFVPGILLLLILRLDNQNPIDLILYSIGLSLSFLTFTALAMNTIYPLIGISKPLSEIPLLVTISAIVLFLLAFCYIREKKNLSKTISINIEKLFHPSTFAFLLLPFLSVFGTYMLNFYDNNIVLLVMLAIISIIPILVASNKIPKEAYPLAIWCISISLLFYHTLILSRFVNSGSFLMMEETGFWDLKIPGTHTPLLAKSLIPFIFFDICRISSMFTYKIIYPLLFSIVPVVLYQVFNRQIKENVAFLSSFFFMSTYFFITIISEIARTGFAILFFVFLMLLMTDKGMNRVKKSGLAIIFAFCVVMSHYGVSYLIMFALVSALFFLLLSKQVANQPNKVTVLSTTTFVSLYLVFIIAWYMYTGGAKGFNWFVNFANHVVNSVKEEFLATESSWTLSSVGKTYSSLSIEITKYLFVVACIFIAIGIIYLVYSRLFSKQRTFHDEYAIYSIVFFGLLVVATLFPTGSTDIGRPFQLFACFLAPFCIIGGTKLIELGKKSLGFVINRRRSLNTQKTKHNLIIFSVFLTIFLLFNSGFVSEVILKDYSAEVGISKTRIMESEVTNSSIHAKMWFYFLYTPEQDLFSSEWFILNGNLKRRVQTDYIGTLRLSSYLTTTAVKKLIEEDKCVLFMTPATKDYYVYLGYHNCVNGVLLHDRFSKWDYISEIQPTLEKKNKIYTNGGSVIYY